MMRKIAALLIIAGIGIGAITVVKAGYYSPKEELSVSLPEAGLSEAPANQEEILPSRIIIPKLDIDTDVQLVGITKKGNMAVPTNFTDTGWYKYGATPGQEGSAVIAGHQTNALSLPAVFMRLPELEEGDDIYVVREDGLKLRFKVIKEEILPYNLTGPKLEEIFNRKGGRYLNLITCDGEWLPEAKTNDKRLVIYAELTD